MNRRVFSSINYSVRAIALLLVFVAFTSCGGQKHDLAFKLYPKDSFMVYVTGTQNLIIDSNAAEADPTTLDTKLTYKFDVTSIDDNGIVSFDITVQNAQMPLFQAILGAALEGKSFSLRMAPDGRIIDFQGTDELRQQISSTIDIPTELVSPTGNPDEIRRFMTTLMEEVSDASLQAKFERIFRIWPSTPVIPGDSWQRDDIAIPSASVNDSTTFTIDSWEGGLVTISTATTFSPNDMNPTTNFKGSGKGKLEIDAIAGFPKSFTYTQRLEGSAQRPDQTVVELIQTDRMFVEFLRL